MSKDRKSEKAAHGVIMCLAFCLLQMVFGIMRGTGHTVEFQSMSQ